MKEIIYLDTNIMNSMLAQLDEGLINSFTLENTSQKSDGEITQSTRTTDGQLNADLKVSTGIFPGGSFGFGGKKGSGGSETESYNTTILEGQKDILNKAFHDHALEILIRKLNDKNLMVDFNNNIQEGDLFFYESSFKFYDFDLLKRSINADAMKKLMLHQIERSTLSYEKAKKITDKVKLNASEREQLQEARKVVQVTESVMGIIAFYEQLYSLSNYSSEMLTNLSLIKADINIGLLKKEFLRESAESLSFRTDDSRKAKMIFRVIGKKNKVFDGTNMGTFNESDLDVIPNLMLDVILGSFKIIRQGDVLVTPIAIYFE